MNVFKVGDFIKPHRNGRGAWTPPFKNNIGKVVERIHDGYLSAEWGNGVGIRNHYDEYLELTTELVVDRILEKYGH